MSLQNENFSFLNGFFENFGISADYHGRSLVSTRRASVGLGAILVVLFDNGDSTISENERFVH